MTTQQNRQKLAFKIISLLSIIRWYNVLLVTIALYFSAIFIFNDITPGIKTIVFDYRMHLAIASIAFLMKAGYIINAFYDFEKDIINRPKETIFGRVISKAFCLNTYVLFVIIGLLLAALASWEVFIFNFIFSFGLWFYSHKLRKKPFTGELSAALLTIAPFFSIGLFYNVYNQMIILYVGYIFVLTITREIIKKMTSIKGDLIVGEKSLPIILGIRKTKFIILGWIILAIVCIIGLYPNIENLPILWHFLLALLILIGSIYQLHISKVAADFKKLNVIFKVLITLAVLCIPLVLKWF